MTCINDELNDVRRDNATKTAAGKSSNNVYRNCEKYGAFKGDKIFNAHSCCGVILFHILGLYLTRALYVARRETLGTETQ